LGSKSQTFAALFGSKHLAEGSNWQLRVSEREGANAKWFGKYFKLIISEFFQLSRSDFLFRPAIVLMKLENFHTHTQLVPNLSCWAAVAVALVCTPLFPKLNSLFLIPVWNSLI